MRTSIVAAAFAIASLSLVMSPAFAASQASLDVIAPTTQPGEVPVHAGLMKPDVTPPTTQPGEVPVHRAAMTPDVIPSTTAPSNG